jgi:hypothetical protein
VEEPIPFDRGLSIALDETIALLELASPSPFRTMLAYRKRNLEDMIFRISPKVADRERCDPETWAIIRKGVLKRDRYRCQGCGGTQRLRVHHIIPISAGGSDDPSNLITLCSDCHGQIHTWLGGGDVRPGGNDATSCTAAA